MTVVMIVLFALFGADVAWHRHQHEPPQQQECLTDAEPDSGCPVR